MQHSLDGIIVVSLLAVQVWAVRRALLYDMPELKQRLHKWLNEKTIRPCGDNPEQDINKKGWL